MSSTKYSFMSDEEFVRFADGMVGDDIQAEAIRRLNLLLDEQKKHEQEIEDLEFEHESEIDYYECHISGLEARIESLECDLEHS